MITCRYCCVIILLFLFCCIQTTLWACTSPVTLAGLGVYPPLTWKEKDKLRGASVTYIESILGQHGITGYTTRFAPWKRLLYQVRHGEVDILLGIRHNYEREKYLSYISPPITQAVQSVFISVNRAFEYQDWDSLRDKYGGSLNGISFGREFDQFAKENLHIEYAATIEQNFKKLDIGRIDYYLGPYMTTLIYLKLLEYEGRIISLPEHLVVLDEYIAVSKKSKCHDELYSIIENFKKMQKAGFMSSLIEEEFEYFFKTHGLTEMF